MKANLLRIIKNKSHEENIKDNNHLTTFLNPYSYLLAKKDPQLFEQFNSICIDGIVLVKILKMFNLSHPERKSFDMTSLAPIVFNDAIQTSKSIYFIGTKPNIIDKSIEIISNTFPELNIIGYRDGYIRESEKNSLLEEIKRLNPDIIICGMGTPLQEQLLIDLKKVGWTGSGYTCGGFLHQTANNIQYYPKWINKYHLRWAYRIYDEPKLFKRYFLEYPKFLAVFLYDYINYRINNHHLS